MRAIEKLGFQFSIGQGYERKIYQERKEEWLFRQVEKIAKLLLGARVGIEEISIVFDPKLKKVAWLREGRLLLNLSRDENILILALREIGIEVYTLEEIKTMERSLPALRGKYLKGEEGAGEEYLRLSEIVHRFSE